MPCYMLRGCEARSDVTRCICNSQEPYQLSRSLVRHHVADMVQGGLGLDRVPQAIRSNHQAGARVRDGHRSHFWAGSDSIASL